MMQALESPDDRVNPRVSEERESKKDSARLIVCYKKKDYDETSSERT